MKTNWKTIAISIAGVFAIIILTVFIVQSAQNSAIAWEEKIESARSDINVQEKRRVDLIYNLADCVMQYDKHESETLIALAEARSSDGDVENVSTAIMAVAEAYPELKSNENYKELMNELSITENRIAEYRENYNKQVESYRRCVRGFPNRIFLNLCGYVAKGYERLEYDAPVSAPQNLFQR